jgi:hypothetical protein
MKTVRSMVLALAFLLIVASPAMAYVGPGAGLTVIGAALAFVGAIVLSIVGFIWYPIKRLLRRRSRKAPGAPAET